MIKVVKFFVGTERVAVIDPETGEAIKGEFAVAPVDWVTYQPMQGTDGGPPSLATSDKVRRLNPDNVVLAEGADGGEKLTHMRAIWSVIGPAYQAWKEGREVPEDGTPIGTWPQLSSEDVEIFRMAGIRTVEQIANITDNMAAKLRMPNVHDLKKLAAMFLANHGAAKEAAEKAALYEKIEMLTQRLDQVQAAIPVEDDEADALRAELDAREVVYDKRWGAKRLREALEGLAA